MVCSCPIQSPKGHQWNVQEFVQGSSCDVSANEGNPFCLISHLAGGRPHSVLGTACDENNQCSIYVQAFGHTLPDRMQTKAVYLGKVSLVRDKIIPLSGPSDFSVDLLHSNSLTVDVVPLSGNPAVRF